MTLVEAASAYAALGSEQRLSLLRQIMRAGTAGKTIGQLGDETGISGANLTHHLKILALAGLIQQTKQGRSVICAAVDYSRFERLNAFLMAECCADVPPDDPGDHAHG